LLDSTRILLQKKLPGVAWPRIERENRDEAVAPTAYQASWEMVPGLLSRDEASLQQ